MEFSVSTFGDIPYDEEVNVQLIRAPKDNLEGCQILQKPRELKAQKFVWLVKRGILTSLNFLYKLSYFIQSQLSVINFRKMHLY